MTRSQKHYIIKYGSEWEPKYNKEKKKKEKVFMVKEESYFSEWKSYTAIKPIEDNPTLCWGVEKCASLVGTY